MWLLWVFVVVVVVVDTDREPVVLLHFSVFGVAGAFVTQEPWIDPVGSTAGL